MPANKIAVALLAKAPVPGQVKTRFCPPCTPEEAANFARAFLQDTAAMLDGFPQVDRWCSYFGPEDDLRQLLNTELLLQRGEGLGERIANATEDLYAMGYESVIVLCADCPTVDAAYMRQTLEQLEIHDVVFGPARDGGCLLVAQAKPAVFLFRDVEMSTDHVYDDMLVLADKAGFTSTTLAPRYDLDYLSDLQQAIQSGELDEAQMTTDAYQHSRFSASIRNIGDEELATPLTTYQAAVAVVTEGVARLGAQTRSLAECHELVLSADAHALVDVPPFDNSSMDGFAVDSASPQQLGPKVMTGQPIPSGFDAIVPWEHVQGAVGEAMQATAGQFIRRQGEDVHVDDVVVRAGTVLSPAHLGLLAACGHPTADVIPKPRVAIFLSGNELRSAGDKLQPGEIYDSNSVMLRALLERSGADVVSVTRLRDDADAIESWFKGQTDVDAIVTAGGASVGEHDWIRTVLGSLGTVDLWRVAVKPGKPFAFGHLGSVPVFVLPGNPASVLACTHAFVIPALHKMAGRPVTQRLVMAALSADVAAPDDRLFLCPVLLHGDSAAPARSANSSVISNHLAANAYALIPPGGALAGTEIAVELFV